MATVFARLIWMWWKPPHYAEEAWPIPGRMNPQSDTLLDVLNEIVSTDSGVSAVGEILRRVIQQLQESGAMMAWEIVPLNAFGDRLPDSIRSCWIFAIRAGAETGAERHPNSHQRSFSLTGSGRFELRDGATWRAHPLVSTPGRSSGQRWVSIPPATWHRLFVESESWGMLSFHTVPPEELVEEKPANPDDLDGKTTRERYAERL